MLVNAVTTSTYDALGNETSTTDPDGRRLAAAFAGILPTTQTVDPAGLSLTTTMQYNGRSDLTQATDPGGEGMRSATTRTGTSRARASRTRVL